MLRILHCVKDDPKFIDDMIEVFDYAKGNHHMEYCYVTEKEDYKLHLKRREQVHILNPSEFIPYILSHEINVIMLHSFLSLSFPLILQIPDNIKLVWFAWGVDLYRTPVEEDPFIKLPLYGPLTKRARNSDLKSLYQRKLSFLFYLFKKKKIRIAVNRVDYFSGVLEIEYELMRKNSFFRAQKLIFNYFKLDLSPQKEIDKIENITNGNDILLGNSAFPANNHIDVLNVLRKIDLGDKKIYIPMSYQRSTIYVEKVKSYCDKYLKGHTVIMEKFLPLQEYNKILSSCGYAIFSLEQQAAIGNISYSLATGKKVFLSNTSISYQHYKMLGFHVFSIQNDLNFSSLNTLLSGDEIKHNKQLLLNYGSSQVYLDRIYDMLQLLDKDLK